MPSQATVTGKIGPGSTLTAAVFTNVTSFTFDITRRVLSLVSNGVESKVDINTAATITCTIAAGNYTLTVA